MKSLYLVDASAMFFRAFYAVRQLTNSKGLPTNALYGYLQMTVKLLRDVKPDYMIYCFDRKEPSFRKDIYPEYKANRGEMPEDLIPQIPYIRKLTEVLGIEAIDMKGFEADDLIGTFAELGKKNKTKVVIVSGDKDFAQLIGPNVSMLDTMKNVLYDEEKAQEKWGVPPGQMIDYLALVGDSSDNIPGVRGIGPKGAQKLLAEYGSIENLYKNIESIKNEKLRTKLLDAKANAFLSHELVTIKTDIDLKFELSDLRPKSIEVDKANSLLEELEFKSFGKRLFGERVETKEVEGQLEEPKQKKSKAFKEAVGSPKDIKSAFQKGDTAWGFSNERGRFLSDGKTVFEIDTNLKKLIPTIESLKLSWKGFDLKSFWRDLGLKKPQQAEWDSLLAAYIARSGQMESFEKLHALYVGSSLAEFPSISDLMTSHLSLEKALRLKLKETNGESVFFEIELPLTSVLFDMETHGVLIDKSILKRQSELLEKDIARIEKEIHDLAGEAFNVASPKQLGEILFKKLSLRVIKKTKTGPSTDSSVMEKLKGDHPIAEKVVEFRELSKLKSTYVDALPDLIDSETGRVHTHFNQTVAATGRLSSTNPNLQNIPIRTKRGREIRTAFIAPKGKVLLSADYSQIELRLLAHITEDSGLCTAFEKGLDVHAATASEVFGIGVDEVDANQRRIAKAVNFGLAYGQSAFGLSESLGISRSEAKDIITLYFQRFPGVQTYMAEIVETAKEKGYVETIFGRRRYLPELSSRNGMQRKFGERAAINAPLQGAASDLVKMAMNNLRGLTQGTIVLQVHDELVFEVPNENLESDISTIKEKMENVAKLRVPLVVDIHSGKNWDEAH